MKAFLATLVLLVSAASARAAALTAAQLDEIERSILPLRHGYDRHEALAAFASQEGATRDDMSAALVAIVERRPPSPPTPPPSQSPSPAPRPSPASSPTPSSSPKSRRSGGNEVVSALA